MARTVSVPNIGGPSVAAEWKWTPSCLAGAAAVNDVVATTEELANFVDEAQSSVLITSIFISNTVDAAPELDIYFLNANTSIGAEDSAPDIDDTELLDLIARVNVPIAKWEDLGGAQVAQLTTADFGVLQIQTAASQTSIWGAIVTQTAYTPVAAGLQLRINYILL